MSIRIDHRCKLKFFLIAALTATVVGACSESRPSASGTDPAQKNGWYVFGRRGLEQGEFFEPRALAVFQDVLFVGDRTGRFQQFSFRGEPQQSWRVPDTSSEVGKPSGACVDPDGNLFVADTHWGRILQLSKSGEIVRVIGSQGTAEGQFMLPTDVAVDSTGTIYVCEYGGNDRVSVLDASGKFIRDFGRISDGHAALQRPSAIVVEDDGSLLVVDTSNHRLCRFSPDGELLDTFGGFGRSNDKFCYPRDVALIDGDIVVADYGNDRLVFMAANGEPLGTIGSGGRNLGQFHKPINLGVSESNLFVADCKNHRMVALPIEVLPITREHHDAKEIEGTRE